MISIVTNPDPCLTADASNDTMDRSPGIEMYNLSIISITDTLSNSAIITTGAVGPRSSR
jgi:hypothetical protein